MSDISKKKFELADKLYDQNGKGGKGVKPIVTMTGHGKGSVPTVKMASRGVGPVLNTDGGANDEGSFKNKLYKQADAKKNKMAMIMGKSKESQKGKASLESVANGRTMYMAGNEHNRS